MSALVTRRRARRSAIQLALGLTAGIALGVAAREAHAEDTAASLFANPKRLEAVQQGCRTNQPWATDALCREAAAAIRRRFRGGGVPYRPEAVEPFPTHPQMQLGPSASPSQAAPGAGSQTSHQVKPASPSKIV